MSNQKLTTHRRKIHNKQMVFEQNFLSSNKKVQSRQHFLLFWISTRSFKFFTIIAFKPVNGTCSIYTHAANTRSQKTNITRIAFTDKALQKSSGVFFLTTRGVFFFLQGKSGNLFDIRGTHLSVGKRGKMLYIYR